MLWKGSSMRLLRLSVSPLSANGQIGFVSYMAVFAPTDERRYPVLHI